jgi:hypothetical protein
MNEKGEIRMSSNNLVFLENIEWFDETGKELVHRLPETGSSEIKWGAQLTVRQSQVGVFFYKGKAIEAFGPGRHTLTTGNIPILTKILSLPWGMSSPLRAEMYFVNMKVFTNLKWGTRDPVAFKDDELGFQYAGGAADSIHQPHGGHSGHFHHRGDRRVPQSCDHFTFQRLYGRKDRFDPQPAV